MAKKSTKTSTVVARVTVYPRPEILDTQGKAIRDALGRIGFGQVADLKAGKSFAITIEGESEKQARQSLEEMCQRLLANPVIEDYTIEMGGEPGESGGGES